MDSEGTLGFGWGDTPQRKGYGSKVEAGLFPPQDAVRRQMTQESAFSLEEKQRNPRGMCKTRKTQTPAGPEESQAHVLCSIQTVREESFVGQKEFNSKSHEDRGPTLKPACVFRHWQVNYTEDTANWSKLLGSSAHQGLGEWPGIWKTRLDSSSGHGCLYSHSLVTVPLLGFLFPWTRAIYPPHQTTGWYSQQAERQAQ